MKRIFRVASLAGCILLAVSLVTTAQADPVADFWNTVTTNNPDLVVGQSTIRVVFVTSGTIDGNGTTQEYYNSFGDGSASSGLITGGLGLTDADWRPLVSTTTDYDNNETPVANWLGYNPDSGTPAAAIYNTRGEQVAQNGSSMLGDWVELSEQSVLMGSGDNQIRDTSSLLAWTGTNSSGAPASASFTQGTIDVSLGSLDPDDQLGGDGTGLNEIATAGQMNAAGDNSSWLEWALTERSTGSVNIPDGTTFGGQPIERSIYVMSGEVTVVPEPSTVLLWLGCSGLAGLIYWRKRRRG